jgi:hypothetical protein
MGRLEYFKLEEEVNLVDSDEVIEEEGKPMEMHMQSAFIVRSYLLMTAKIKTWFYVSCATNGDPQIVLTPKLRSLCDSKTRKTVKATIAT